MSSDNTIVRAAIYPGIGIARVGNSENEFFIGPEVPHRGATDPDTYKDASGALKRQAARFRVYGFNAAGEVVGELTAENADIEWSVAVANRKSWWYAFQPGLDIKNSGAQPTPLRNANFTGESRSKLAITPGERSVSGVSQTGPDFVGKFIDEDVYLGELRTDDKGRLLFLGGYGKSNSPFPNNPPTTYGNNEGWHDDTSDGPVSACVKVGGREIPVESAWVVTAPPNYAPDVISVLTMYDVMVDTYQGQWLTPKARPSFTGDILPLLEQFVWSQWVNKGFFVQFGWKAPNDFLQAETLARLSQAGDEFAEARRQIFNAFRDPAATEANILAWPWMYGDLVALVNPPADGFLSVTDTLYGYLKQWADGDFEADWNPSPPPPPPAIEGYPLAEQPDVLDKASMWYCLGGPFHPGCEMTWPMRHAGMYSAPFRIRPRAADDPEPDYGPTLSYETLVSDNGPLYANAPGDLTRWMAVPWQTDTSSCRSGYDAEYDPYLPTFWPARVPNHVLTDADYQIVMDTGRDRAERIAAFNRRAVWYRGLKGEYLQQIDEMVSEFGKLGVVERRPGPENDADFPPVMYVESPPGFDTERDPSSNLCTAKVEKVCPRAARDD